MVTRSLFAFFCAALLSTPASAHDVNAPAGAPQPMFDPANPGHVHIHTPGPSPLASTGVSSPDDEDYSLSEPARPATVQPTQPRQQATVPPVVEPGSTTASLRAPKPVVIAKAKPRVKPQPKPTAAKPKPVTTAVVPTKKPRKKKKPSTTITSIY
jgi:outer membrane biosynthesis protein TonB